MVEEQDLFQRDVSVVLRHIRFVIALFILAILAAVASALVAGSENKALSEAQVEIGAVDTLLNGVEAAPTLETFQALAESDEVAKAAAEDLGMPPEDLNGKFTVSTEEADSPDASKLGTLSIEAVGSSKGQAKSIAGSVIDAFAEAAAGLSVDPEALQSLREQEVLARQRLEEYDPAQGFELIQVQTDLSLQRKTLTRLKQDMSAIDRGLAFLETVGSRPLGELVVAISGVMGAESSPGLDTASTVEELKRGLELRLELTEDLIEETEKEVAALAEREQELSEDVAERNEALAVHGQTQRSLEAAELMAAQTDTEVEITKRGEDISSSVNWAARLGAAAAFGLVAGVVGAFSLEFLAPLWNRRRQGTPPRQPQA